MSCPLCSTVGGRTPLSCSAATDAAPGLFDDAHHDARMLQRTLGTIPVSGFLAAGEIGPVGGHNFVHAFAASMALLRER